MLELASLAAGLIFGLGLIVSGMADPGKVLGFLDLAGRWDPSLALVMAGAIGVGVFAFGLARRRGSSVLGGTLSLPTTQGIDARLVVGSLLFGIGWGLAGFCPGPALVAVGMGQAKALWFTAFMLLGMLLFEGVERVRAMRAAPVAQDA